MKIHALIISLFMIFFVVGCTSQSVNQKDDSLSSVNQDSSSLAENSQTELEIENITFDLEIVTSEDNELDFSELDDLDNDFALFE